MRKKTHLKTGIITYYQIDNYGANLQAFAMLLLFKNSALVKHNCEAISDRNTQRLSTFLKLCKTPKQRLCVTIKSIKTKISFELFRVKKLTFCEPNECNAFVLGGDQIWNTDINKCDLHYFQSDYDNWTSAYSASFGYESFPKSLENLVSPLFKRMEIIGIREIHGQDILKNQFDKDSIVVLDPVLLVSDERWKKEFGLRTIDNYNIGFLYYQKEINYDDIRCFRLLYPGLDYVVYSNCPINHDNVNQKGCGEVKEWLSHIFNASIVVTTSYHAVVFSLLFHRQFVYVEHNSNKNSSRFYSLFKLLGIPFEINAVHDKEKWIIPILDYEKIDKELKSLRIQSNRVIESIERGIANNEHIV